jgi:hypothetical protein
MFANKSKMAFLALALCFSAASALNPSCAPGGNFDLSKFVLQLPSGSTNHPDQIPASSLDGCGGYQDPSHQYFFTESGDGAMVMKAPGGGKCATFPGVPRCRSEFGETNSWSSQASTNRLMADLLVTSGSSICIGQVFQSNSNNKPLVSHASKPLCINHVAYKSRPRFTTTAMAKSRSELSLSQPAVKART